MLKFSRGKAPVPRGQVDHSGGDTPGEKHFRCDHLRRLDVKNVARSVQGSRGLPSWHLRAYRSKGTYESLASAGGRPGLLEAENALALTLHLDHSQEGYFARLQGLVGQDLTSNRCFRN